MQKSIGIEIYYSKKLNKIKSKDTQDSDDNGDENDVDDDGILNDDNYSNKKMWRSVKELSNNYKQQPPRMLNVKGKFTTSLRKICNECNIFFVNKVKELWDIFKINPKIAAIDILKFLIPRSKERLIFKHNDNEGVQKLLKSAKASNSLGNDFILMKTIKKLGASIEKYVEHLINAIIDSKIYPNIFCVPKITPALKADKLAIIIDSYWPINSLSTLEKFVKQHFKNFIWTI